MNHLFAEMPVLSIVTNFSSNGDFERIYLITEHSGDKKSDANKKRKTKMEQMFSAWNGPLRSTFHE